MPLTIEISPTGYIGKLMRNSLEQGLEQGREEASRALVRRVLAKRFGKLSRTYAARFEQLGEARAEALIESSYTAASGKELFESLT